MVMISIFTEKDLRALAGEQSFERGQGYIDAVADLEIDVDGLTATVHGGSATRSL